MGKKGDLSILKDLLFEEEKKKYEELSHDLSEVNDKIDRSLSNRVVPDHEVNQIMGKMMQVMPDKLGPTITQTLKVQIKESRDDVVQALFPIIGQMIKKYVAQEIEVLSEKIDKQVESLLSFENLILRIKASFLGKSYAELLIQKASEAEIQEIFIIEENSGILLASYSRNKSFDQDMIAGMLTAIKSFANDSFSKGNQSLENITYQSLSINIQSFEKFYVATAVSGVMTKEFQSKLNDIILNFIKDIASKYSELDEAKLAKKIEFHFRKI
ncbi:hypothetical protein [Ekhidna sp.]|uniref:hypothetical protein n=1 Tax=Ekhidna sp. TaxID=2608089 RepID=UPI003BA8783A